LSAYGPADATVIPKPRHPSPRLNPTTVLYLTVYEFLHTVTPGNIAGSFADTTVLTLSWLQKKFQDPSRSVCGCVQDTISVHRPGFW